MKFTQKQEELLKKLRGTGGQNSALPAVAHDPRTVGCLIQLGFVCAMDGGIYLSDSGRQFVKQWPQDPGPSHEDD